MWTCLLLKLVSNETSFSCKHIRLILEPLELDLNTLQVPDRWVPSPPTIKLFLEPLSLYLWLLSQPTDPLVLFNEMFTDLVSGYELLLCKERCKPAPPHRPHDECILSIQTPYLCICWRLPTSDISLILRGHFYSRAVHHSGAPPCINTLAVESCQILHWIFLLPLHLSLCPKEHESTEVQTSWDYLCGQLSTLTELHCMTAAWGC